MAVNARLKLLGIDLTKANDIGEALDAAFSAIQKLTAQVTYILFYFIFLYIFFFFTHKNKIKMSKNV